MAKTSEAEKEYNRRWKEQNKDKVLESNKLYREVHREEINAKQRQKYLNWNDHQHSVNKEYNRRYRREHPSEFRRYSQSNRVRSRKEILDLLGDKCAKCGFNDWRALQIDHINGGGSRERIAAKSPAKYYKNIKESIQKGEGKYQVLCANCNQIKLYKKTS